MMVILKNYWVWDNFWDNVCFKEIYVEMNFFLFIENKLIFELINIV